MTCTSTGRPQAFSPCSQPSAKAVYPSPFILELYTHDAVTNFFAAIPGAVLGNEDLVAVRGRKHRTGVKAHAQGGYMRPQVQRTGATKSLQGRLAPNSGSAISLLWQ